ncbi:MAG: putative cytosol aminopeptidase [Chlamydiia bacterium]|nr:putative cytosol aminopeptidase [Chlamydiia bacterium]
MKSHFNERIHHLVKHIGKALILCGLFLTCSGETMEITLEKKENQKASDALIVPCFIEDGTCMIAACDGLVSEEVNPIIDLGDFKGKLKETSLIYTRDLKEKRLILLGLGEKKKLTKESLRRAVASATKCALAKSLKDVSICSFSHSKFKDEEVCYLLAESFCLTNYSYNNYRSKKELKEDGLKSVRILADCKCNDTIKEAKLVAESVNYSRDLVNGNADDITPKYLVESAKSLEKLSKKIKVEAFDRSEIEKQKLGLFEAVAKSSPTEPYFIIVSYKGNPNSDDHSVIVGKGITYDTGGLSLKPTSGMVIMKCDMGGGAAVLGAIRAIAALDLKVNVTAIVAATENSIGKNSFKPGDVYTGYSGTTVEITNTDAEGRLALADSLSYAVKNLKPNRIIDLATLTGAAEVALGSCKSALFSNTKKFANAIYAAGESSGDRVWEMPLDDDYKDLISSSIADIRNSGSRAGSLSFSAMFLKEFVEETPWAHLDIAGPAFLESPRDYHRSSATGAGVRLLYEFFKNHVTDL